MLTEFEPKATVNFFMQRFPYFFFCLLDLITEGGIKSLDVINNCSKRISSDFCLFCLLLLISYAGVSLGIRKNETINSLVNVCPQLRTCRFYKITIFFHLNVMLFITYSWIALNETNVTGASYFIFI